MDHWPPRAAWSYRYECAQATRLARFITMHGCGVRSTMSAAASTKITVPLLKFGALPQVSIAHVCGFRNSHRASNNEEAKSVNRPRRPKNWQQPPRQVNLRGTAQIASTSGKARIYGFSVAILLRQLDNQLIMNWHVGEFGRRGWGWRRGWGSSVGGTGVREIIAVPEEIDVSL